MTPFVHIRCVPPVSPLTCIRPYAQSRVAFVQKDLLEAQLDLLDTQLCRMDFLSWLPGSRWARGL